MTTSYHAEIVEYVTLRDRNNEPITLQQFVQDKSDLIVQHTTLNQCHDIPSVWTSRLSKALKEAKLKLTVTKKKVDWGPVSLSILQNLATNQTLYSIDNSTKNKKTGNNSNKRSGSGSGSGSGSDNSGISGNSNDNNGSVTVSNNGTNSGSSKSRSSSSKSDSCKLVPEAVECFKLKHDSFIPNKKWVLSSGRCVEDIMFEYGQKLSHEHPVHSYILCVDDSNWNNVFTEDEMSEILNEGNPSLPVLDEDVQNILQTFKGTGKKAFQETLDEEKLDTNMLDHLIKTALTLGPFDPRIQYEQFWILSSMNQLLAYYANDIITTMGHNISELDLVARFWSILDRSFDDIKVITTRDRTCEATSIRVNEGRKVNGISEIGNKKSSIRSDLLLIRKEVEYGCSELGRIDDNVPSRKEIAETELHCPKTMKDIFDRAASLVKNDKDMIRKLRVVCFHQTNRRMKVSILDCPNGYICRIMQSQEFSIPLTAQLIPAQVIPIIELTLQTKHIVLETARNLEAYQMNNTNSTGLKCLQPKKNDTILLPSTLTMNAYTEPTNLKRRKVNEKE